MGAAAKSILQGVLQGEPGTTVRRKVLLPSKETGKRFLLWIRLQEASDACLQWLVGSKWAPWCSVSWSWLASLQRVVASHLSAHQSPVACKLVFWNPTTASSRSMTPISIEIKSNGTRWTLCWNAGAGVGNGQPILFLLSLVISGHGLILLCCILSPLLALLAHVSCLVFIVIELSHGLAFSRTIRPPLALRNPLVMQFLGKQGEHGSRNLVSPFLFQNFYKIPYWAFLFNMDKFSR